MRSSGVDIDDIEVIISDDVAITSGSEVFVGHLDTR